VGVVGFMSWDVTLLNDLHSIRPLTKATLTDTQERLVTSLLLNHRGYLRANHWK